MSIVNRNQLKKAFEKGSIPSQEDFENLIDSMLHKKDDGLISEDEGLKISAKGSARKLISFFNNMSDFKSKWSIEQHPKNTTEFGLNLIDDQGVSRLFISADGNIGIGTVAPQTKLQIEGNVHMQGRRGTHTYGKIPGDGQWYTITPKLNQCHAFEVIAKIGKPGKGLYAMTHAFALSTFGSSSNRIQKIQAYYGSFRNKITLRWVGTTFNYYLQMKTKRNYGKENFIKYYVTNLWWEDDDED